MKIVCLFCLFVLNLYGKVLLITHAYNRPEFIDLQCRCFAKFLCDDYEFVVFNDAPPGPIHDAIVAMCDKWQLQCIPIPQELHQHTWDVEFWQNDAGAEGTRRHVDGIQYSLEYLGYDFDGEVAIIDSDMFLIKPFSIAKNLERYPIVAITRGEFGGGKSVTHLWPGLTCLAMNRLPDRRTLDFRCGVVRDPRKNREFLVDSGGYTLLLFEAASKTSCHASGVLSSL